MNNIKKIREKQDIKTKLKEFLKELKEGQISEETKQKAKEA